MERDEYCKGCRETVRLSDVEIQRIYNEKIRVKSVKLADEDTCRNRMAVCNACPFLDYGTTCRFCGCLVQVRAKLAGAYCPAPTGRKW